MNLSLSDLALLPGAKLSSRAPLSGASRLSGVSTDSRAVSKGGVFVALRGEKFDGHAFVPDVVEAGAAAVVVDRSSDVPASVARRASVVRVPDTAKALGDLALIYRMKFDIPIIAVGGSNGKTTTKEMIASVLAKKYSVLATEGNFNNHLGVPQMLLRLRPKHEVAVLELGTNHFGELQYLCSVAIPTHGVVTNIGREHLEFFRTIEGVAEEETELFRFMQASSGTAFVNLDDPYLAKSAAGLEGAVTFGMKDAASMVRAIDVSLDRSGCASFECRETLGSKKPRAFHVTLGASGMHNVSNALSAIAVGAAFGVPVRSIQSALHEFRSASKRMEVSVTPSGVTVLNDTYNANPDSVSAALDTLMALKTASRKLVVLGDMFELGRSAEEEHRMIGRAIGTLAPDFLVTVGPLARLIGRESRLNQAHHFETKEEALDFLRSVITPGDAVLVKGSRGMRMEEVASGL
ncbi:MAG: UDP-N-acetylmuramoyl-tripeptide--D-alanyl-D-alanine ligase [Acidobacteriota bacterium]